MSDLKTFKCKFCGGFFSPQQTLYRLKTWQSIIYNLLLPSGTMWRCIISWPSGSFLLKPSGSGRVAPSQYQHEGCVGRSLLKKEMLRPGYITVSSSALCLCRGNESTSIGAFICADFPHIGSPSWISTFPSET